MTAEPLFTTNRSNGITRRKKSLNDLKYSREGYLTTLPNEATFNSFVSDDLCVTRSTNDFATMHRSQEETRTRCHTNHRQNRIPSITQFLQKKDNFLPLKKKDPQVKSFNQLT